MIKTNFLIFNAENCYYNLKNRYYKNIIPNFFLLRLYQYYNIIIL